MCVCVLVPSDQRLDEQGVKNHSKMMVLKVSDAELKQQMSKEEEKKKQQSESLQRTQKGFQILSERGTPNLPACVFKSLKKSSVAQSHDFQHGGTPKFWIQ